MGKEATRVRRRERKTSLRRRARELVVQQHDHHHHRRAGQHDCWSSAGTMGFKGSRKSTPYAAQVAAEDVSKKAQEHGMRTLEVEVAGPGSGRESALRALQAAGFTVTSIRDVNHDPAQRLPVRASVGASDTKLRAHRARDDFLQSRGNDPRPFSNASVCNSSLTGLYG